MRLPAKLELLDVRESIREIQRVVERFDVGPSGNPDLNGTRFTNVGWAMSRNEFASLGQVQNEVGVVRDRVTALENRMTALERRVEILEAT